MLELECQRSQSLGLLFIYTYPLEISSSLMALNNIDILMTSKFIEHRPFPFNASIQMPPRPLHLLNGHLRWKLNDRQAPPTVFPIPGNRNSTLLGSQGKNLRASLGSSFFYTLHPIDTTKSYWLYPQNITRSQPLFTTSTASALDKPLCVVGIGDMNMKRHTWLNSFG